MQVQPGKEYKYLPRRRGGGGGGRGQQTQAPPPPRPTNPAPPLLTNPPPLTYGLFQTVTAAQRELDLDDDLTDQDGRV